MKTYPFSLREASRRARVAGAAAKRDKREAARRAHVANAALKQSKRRASYVSQDVPEAPDRGRAQGERQSRRSPGARVAFLQFLLLVGFSAFLSGVIALGTDPDFGVLPVVLEYPPGFSERVGYRIESRATRIRLRGVPDDSKPPLVRNMGEHFAYPPEEGLASWYGYDHLGRRTATGAWFDPEAMTVAHRTFPLGSVVRVTRTDTGASITAEVNDRGPYVKGRIVDLARKPAEVLGMLDIGIVPCLVELLRYPMPSASSSDREMSS